MEEEKNEVVSEVTGTPMPEKVDNVSNTETVQTETPLMKTNEQ